MPESSNTGGRKPRVSDRDLLDVFRSTTDPVLSTAEVADAVPIKRRGVLNRLRDLEDAGELASKQIGGRNTVWWILDGGDADTFDAEELRGDPTTTLADESDTLEDRARERIGELDLAGSGTDYDRRRDAVLKMYDHLRDHPGERLGKAEFADLLDGVDVGYGGGFESLWANWVKSSGERPNALDTLPGVELRGDDYVFEVDE